MVSFKLLEVTQQGGQEQGAGLVCIQKLSEGDKELETKLPCPSQLDVCCYSNGRICIHNKWERSVAQDK